MGFSLNKISPITFDVEHPQTPVDRGIKKQSPQHLHHENDELHKFIMKAANLNEAHHELSGNASYNPDESITNKNVQGRFIPPNTDNMATQPQQQSSSEEGSKENTILNGPRHDRERNAQSRPSKPTDERPQGSAPTAPTTWAGGPPQAPPVTNTNRNHQDPPEHNDTNGSTKAPTKGQGATKIKEGIGNSILY